MPVKVRYGQSESANGKVSRTGDTMTGNLLLKSTNLLDGTAPITTTDGNGGLRFVDSEDNLIGLVFPTFEPDGFQGLTLGGFRNVNGADKWGVYRLGVNADGTTKVVMGSLIKNAFLSALGLTVAKTTTLSSIADSAGSGRVDSAEYWQYGNIAQVHLTITTTAAISSLTTVATMKSGKRPVSYSVLGSTNKTVIGAYINANGSVRINGTTTIASGTELHLFCTYILA